MFKKNKIIGLHSFILKYLIVLKLLMLIMISCIDFKDILAIEIKFEIIQSVSLEIAYIQFFEILMLNSFKKKN